MVTLNEKLELLNINEAGKNTFGKDSLTGNHFLQLFKNGQEIEKLLFSLNDTDEMLDKEVELKTRDNEEYQGILTIIREELQDGSSYLQGVFHDITELKNRPILLQRNLNQPSGS